MRPRSGVFADIAQNVSQLKRHAALFGERQGAARIEAEDVDDGQPDHRRHLVAVAVLARRTSRRGAAPGPDETPSIISLEVLVRDAEATHGVVESAATRDGPLKRPCERLFHFRAPAVHRRRAMRAGLVAQVVAVAHEGVDARTWPCAAARRAGRNE